MLDKSVIVVCKPTPIQVSKKEDNILDNTSSVLSSPTKKWKEQTSKKTSSINDNKVKTPSSSSMF